MPPDATVTDTVTAARADAAPAASGTARACATEYTRHGIYPECPLCGGGLHPEHAHFKCGSCGWRDSCCD